MIKKTISQIKKKIKNGNFSNKEHKTELLSLVNTLEKEVKNLKKIDTEHAESITNYTKMSTHEATRQNKNHDLLDHSVNGLSKSVKEFEVSHPVLTDTVNRICHILSGMGI